MKSVFLALAVTVAISFFSEVSPQRAERERGYGQCVQDNPSRIFTVYAGSFDDNTPKTCIAKCAVRGKVAPDSTPGFAFAGVQVGQQCFCGQCRLPKEIFLPPAKCNVRCTGDSNIVCGGHWAMNVYATGIKPNC